MGNPISQYDLKSDTVLLSMREIPPEERHKPVVVVTDAHQRVRDALAAGIADAAMRARIAEMVNPGFMTAIHEREDLQAECLALGVSLDGNETTDRLRWLRDEATGQHAPFKLASVGELSEVFRKFADDMMRGRRKARNKRKRERRARRKG